MSDWLKEWHSEVTDFLLFIGKKAEVRLLRDLRKLAIERYKLRDITKPIGHSLFELVTSFDGMEYRCIYVFHNDDIIVLVCFIKKRQKTPTEKIELARLRYSILVRQEVSLGDITLH